MRRWRWLVLMIVAMPGAISTQALPADTTLTVNTLNDAVADDGLCSLREAFAAVETTFPSGSMPGECPAVASDSNSIVDLRGLSGTLTLNSTLGIVNAARTVELRGSGQSVLTIRLSAGAASGATLELLSGAAPYDLLIRDVTISGGKGSGLKASGSTHALTLERVTLTGNAAYGMDAPGAVTVSDSHIHHNTGGGANVTSASIDRTLIEQNGGRGITLGGTVDLTALLRNSAVLNNADSGVVAGSYTTLENVTIAGNTAATCAGLNSLGGSLTAVSMRYVTVTANTSSGFGGGVCVAYWDIIGSVIAGNTSTGTLFDDCYGYFFTVRYSLIENTYFNASNQGCKYNTPLEPNLLAVSPTLGAVQNRGGPTPTVSISGAAVDFIPTSSGFCGADLTDQRGFPRPYNGACDIGAYEAQPDIPDLISTVTLNSGSIISGATHTVAVTVRNEGSGAASGVLVTVTLPNASNFVSVSQPGCTRPTAAVLFCTVGALAVGATFSADIVLRSYAWESPASDVEVSAAVTLNEIDPTPTSNSASASAQVSPLPYGARLVGVVHIELNENALYDPGIDVLVANATVTANGVSVTSALDGTYVLNAPTSLSVSVSATDGNLSKTLEGVAFSGAGTTQTLNLGIGGPTRSGDTLPRPSAVDGFRGSN